MVNYKLVKLKFLDFLFKNFLPVCFIYENICYIGSKFGFVILFKIQNDFFIVFNFNIKSQIAFI